MSLPGADPGIRRGGGGGAFYFLKATPILLHLMGGAHIAGSIFGNLT